MCVCFEKGFCRYSFLLQNEGGIKKSLISLRFFGVTTTTQRNYYYTIVSYDEQRITRVRIFKNRKIKVFIRRESQNSRADENVFRSYFAKHRRCILSIRVKNNRLVRTFQVCRFILEQLAIIITYDKTTVVYRNSSRANVVDFPVRVFFFS